MRAPPLVIAAAGLALAACNPTAPKGVDKARLDGAISKAIGDPNTCVLLVKAGGGEVVYRYGDYSTCARSMPACSQPGMLNADELARAAAGGDARTASCASAADGSRRVGWASGPVAKSEGARYGDLVYAAVMEGPTVLPGMAIKARLEAALKRAGM